VKLVKLVELGGAVWKVGCANNLLVETGAVEQWVKI